MPTGEAQRIVAELVADGFIEIVRQTPDGEIALSRENALEVARERRFWRYRHDEWPHEPRWPHEIHLTDEGFELYNAVHDQRGELYSLE